MRTVTVVMLPTEKASPIHFTRKVLRDNVEMVSLNSDYIKDGTIKRQHLCFISEDKLMEGDKAFSTLDTLL
jgi:hypothetical protein